MSEIDAILRFAVSAVVNGPWFDVILILLGMWIAGSLVAAIRRMTAVINYSGDDERRPDDRYQRGMKKFHEEQADWWSKFDNQDERYQWDGGDWPGGEQ